MAANDAARKKLGDNERAIASGRNVKIAIAETPKNLRSNLSVLVPIAFVMTRAADSANIGSLCDKPLRDRPKLHLSRTRHASKIALLALMGSVVVSASQRINKAGNSCAHTPAPRITVIGVSNFAKVTPNLFRGGQPKSAGYANLKKMGVDIVIDLRLSGKGNERRDVTRAGMRYASIPWHCLFPKDKDFAKFLLLLRENKAKKIFVHCRYGDDRTGMMVAAYRMAVLGWTPEEARKEMDAFGFHHVLCHSLVPYEKHFPEHLQKGKDFQPWREDTVAPAQ